MYFSLKSGSQKSYLQWFPLTRLTASDKEALCSEDFYNKYIKNFSYILFQNNLHQSNKGNVMSAFAYYKNFFDRVTADIDFVVNHSSKRPNYNKFYTENSLVQFYKNVPNGETIIKRAHRLRNSNPLSHSSSELLDNNDSSNDLKTCIAELSKLLLSCASNYLQP